MMNRIVGCLGGGKWGLLDWSWWAWERGGGSGEREEEGGGCVLVFLSFVYIYFFSVVVDGKGLIWNCSVLRV
jgi:hypothetical protein